MALEAKVVSLSFINALRRALERTSVVTSQKEVFQEFLTCFGWDVALNDAQLQAVQEFMNVEAPLAALDAAVENIENGGDELELLAELLAGVIGTVDLIKAWSNGNLTILPAPFDGTTDFWDDFPEDMVNQLTIMALREEVPILHHILFLFGILDQEVVNPGGVQRLPFVRRRIRWNKLGDLVTDPLGALKTSVKWGQAGLDLNHEKLLSALGFLVDAVGLPARLSAPSPVLLDAYYSPSNAERTKVKELNVPLLLEVAQDFASYAELGFKILPITPAGNTGAKPNGIVIAPLIHGAVQGTADGEADWTLALTGNALIDGAFRLELRPEGAALELSIGESALDVGLSLRGQFDPPFVLIGARNSHRVEVEGAFLAAEIKGTAASPEIVLKVGTGDGPNAPRLRFIFQAGEGDGFLKEIVGSKPQPIDFAGHLSFSSSHGIGINGSVGFQLQFPLHLSLGPVEVQSLTVGTQANEDGGLSVPIGLDIKAALGPVSAVVAEIGAKLRLTPRQGASESGLLGNLDLDWVFHPPKGVGLSIDAEAVKGGGFLDIDVENGRYVGMMQLEIQETIDVTAIGLITTKLPGGVDGFSLLILISAEFQPIQLGMGFTLNGVGGLLGLNRTMVIDVLREGVRDNSLKSILFPEDPVANAMQIISDLRTAFPPYEGQFVIGPMAKIGYGTPSIITLELGLVIELPDPLRIAILGVLKAILPEEESALIKIQVNFLGTIDFEAGKLTFDASLFDSRLLAFDLSGDMAVRVFWKGEPQFLLSVGGFHPAFEPPPLDLPVLRRLALQLLKGDNPRIRLETYFAVTSNTVQFGARLELYAGAGSFSIYGFLAFDVLFQFSPFYFIASIGAMLALRAGSSTLASISLSLTLEGTTPWKAKGTAKLKLFWFLTITVRFSKTWGERRDTLLEDVTVLDRVVEALQSKNNWQAALPSQRNLLVSLKEIAPIEDQVVVHPFGGLTVSQKVVPLNVRIDKFGNTKPSDFNEFSITGHQAGGAPIHAADIATAKDYFAPAQFFKKSDAEKLSADSFVKYDAGFALGTSEQLESSYYVKREVEYELSYIDSQREVRFPIFAGLFAPVAALFNLFTQNRAVARSPLSFAARRKSALGPETVHVNQEGYAVANVSDLTAAGGTTVLASEAEAFALMNQLQREQPALAGRLQVVPSFELNRELAA